MFDSSIKNKRKSTLIIALFVIFLGLLVYFISYWFGLSEYAVGISLIVAISTTVSSYYNCDKIVLSISNAKPATREQNQRMVENLEGLCIAAGLSVVPKLYIVEDSAPNAFATGRDPEHSIICVTTGLLDKLDDYELEGVLAHELSHIKNYDIRLQTVATVFVGFIGLLADIFFRIGFRSTRNRDSDNNSPAQAVILIVGLIFVALSPIAANLLKLALSRRREYLADSSAIELTRNPQGLIDALTKISSDPEPLEVANKTTENLYICSPFKGEDAEKFTNKIFSTHPPIEDRINALRNIS